MTRPPPMPIAEVPVRGTGQKRIINACEKHWSAHKGDCSGFVKAVAAEIGIFLPNEQADPIIKYISKWETASWWKIRSPKSAGELAEEGYFVLACLTMADSGRANGHVAVVTSGYKSSHRGDPRGYWGAYKSVGEKNATMNYSFDMDQFGSKVSYFRCMWKR